MTAPQGRVAEGGARGRGLVQPGGGGHTRRTCALRGPQPRVPPPLEPPGGGARGAALGGAIRARGAIDERAQTDVRAVHAAHDRRQDLYDTQQRACERRQHTPASGWGAEAEGARWAGEVHVVRQEQNRATRKLADAEFRQNLKEQREQASAGATAEGGGAAGAPATADGGGAAGVPGGRAATGAVAGEGAGALTEWDRRIVHSGVFRTTQRGQTIEFRIGARVEVHPRTCNLCIRAIPLHHPFVPARACPIERGSSQVIRTRIAV